MEELQTNGDCRTEKHYDSKFPLTVHKCHVDTSSFLACHYHDNFEIIFVLSKNLFLEIGSAKNMAEKGDIFFVNMYQLHSARSVDGTSGYFYAIVFDKKILEAVNINDYYMDYIKPFIDGSSRFPEKIAKNTLLYKQVRESVEVIIKECKVMEIAYEVYVTSAIEKLFASFMRYGAWDKEKVQAGFSDSSKLMLEKILKFIEDKYSLPVTLKDAAEHLNISKHYLCRIIKRLTALSFTQFLNIYRVRQAEILLRTSAEPVVMVAEKVGFSNLSYFNRIFLRYTGHTPSKTRNHAKVNIVSHRVN